VGAVVRIGWRGFTVGTEVGVIADSTLVPVPNDVTGGLAGAQMAVAIYSLMANFGWGRADIEYVIKRCKFVPWMGMSCILGTLGAEIPVWAVQALVADAVDRCVTPIADGLMTNSTSGSQEHGAHSIQDCVLRRRLEAVKRMVAMLLRNMARKANVVIFANGASNEALLRKASHTRVADSGLISRVCRFRLWARGLSRARDELSVIEMAFDEPMFFITMNALLNT